MKKTTISNTIMLFALIAGFNFSCAPGEKKDEVKTKAVTSKDNTTLNGAIIKNNIDLDATGVKLKEAYLVDENYKPLAGNKAAVGEKIYLAIILDTGWVKENGKSFIGASERILTPAGKVVVAADDIFKDQGLTGMDAKDAKEISLSAMITEADPGLNDFEVQFRVWDKRSNAEVKGKYYFSLKK